MNTSYIMNQGPNKLNLDNLGSENGIDERR